MKILLVDDNKEITSYLKSALESECYEVDVADDGERGAFLAKTNDYDLIVLDYMMPKKNGREVCEEVRKDGLAMPILMLSIESEAHTKADLLNMGADDYLSKPFSLEELLARIKALLRRPKNTAEEEILVDNLIVDSKKHLVSRGKARIHLTIKEFMLLEYLAQRVGEVITRGMILEHVWDINADPFSNTIEAHISNLRKKIDLPGERKLIYTVPGRGYKMDLEK